MVDTFCENTFPFLLYMKTVWFFELIKYSCLFIQGRHRWVIYTDEMNGKNTFWEVDGSMVPPEW